MRSFVSLGPFVGSYFDMSPLPKEVKDAVAVQQIHSSFNSRVILLETLSGTILLENKAQRLLFMAAVAKAQLDDEQFCTVHFKEKTVVLNRPSFIRFMRIWAIGFLQEVALPNRVGALRPRQPRRRVFSIMRWPTRS